MKTYDRLSEAGVEELCEEVMDRDKVIIELWNALAKCNVTQDEVYLKYKDFALATRYFYGDI